MNIEKDISLKEFSAIKLGGPATYFVRAGTSEQLVAAIEWARQEEERFFVLGLGANTIFADEGFAGLVILQKNQACSVDKFEVYAESGVVLGNLIDAGLERNLLGLEQFSGIPSTVGGAAFINLHYYQALFSDLVASANVYDVAAGKSLQVDKDWFEFGYEQSRLQEVMSLSDFIGGKEQGGDSAPLSVPSFVLLNCILRLKAVDQQAKEQAVAAAKEIVATRNSKYPADPSVGCIFQNLDQKANANGLSSHAASYYIDQCGLKGLRVGGIEISQKHANMFINPEGKGTCRDLLELIEIVKQKVYERFSINLREEVQIIR